MRCQGFALFFRFPSDDWRTQHQISHHQRHLGIVKGQHIGGVVFLSVAGVQSPAFFVPNDAHRDFSITRQGVAQVTAYRMPGQRSAVSCGIWNLSELQ
jgi:hypothetical protein